MVEYSGTGDPARSLALLWRTRERTSRKGRPDLSVDRIVRTAIEIADAEGLGALAMRRIAERLGVGTMTLYTYVPGKGELLDVMLDTVNGEVAMPEDVPGGWRGRLEHVARENWALYQRHPWMLQVATIRPVLGPNLMAKYDYELRAVDGIGLTEIEMDSVLSLVLGFVTSAVRGALEASQAEQSTGMTDEQWWGAYAPLLSRVLDPNRFPTASRVGSAAGAAYGAAHDPAHGFEFGLQRVLDGIETFVNARAAELGSD
ncbi:transcriptional regulator, TetR family [Streptoalloteichus tenebrarius]|uniref:Transcriptional regulator, TetR family n=1 Tax=Streptoalloteichus tenebrarius (strain ATCC 17920 / DSM 40477 / JCM 4838 / CBS 697.72 / NBRC 16177 / NCIMB 11028 / NRRL B-12390 / A12253. 1 / ISP 5477) TaxID=1933 RepID=A0ABT1HRZ6_STRSD|nr:TetR/AcrR family transcriptional regulator [Streptoalloteichus tenebrarius]MCP2258291.1 transcriptional regulator, TetR family [Streptoalloteichus tenebrarius]BFF04475.1 TetR/AcrR family transcriptional regulator [Streptoalloteichus tenebrarius]